MSFLPIEIIDEIINVLAQDDLSFPSTKTCALVCHEFHRLCRKHLFASIALNHIFSRSSVPYTNVTKATTRMLQQLLDTSPEIGDHIRNLTYNIASDDLRDASLVETFRKITRLKSFSVWHFNLPMLQWNNNLLRPALLHLLHLPTLIHFKIMAIENFLVSDLAPCSNLERLKFEHLTVFDEESLASNLPERSIRLRRVSAGLKSAPAIMKMCAILCADGEPFIDFSWVNDLTIKIHRQNDVQASLNVLNRCRRLTSIDVDLEVWDSMVNLTHIGLSKMLHPSMQTLKHLHVNTSFAEETGSDDPLAGLCNELEEMKDKNIIETVTIGVSIEIDSDCKRGGEWGRLDTALAQPGWPKLQRVSLAIVVWSYVRANDELERALKKLPQTQLPKLSSSKSPLFEFSVREARI